MWDADPSSIDDQIRRMAEDNETRVSRSTSGSFWTGPIGAAAQQAMGIGLGYLSRRADVEIQSRMAQPGSVNVRGAQSARITNAEPPSDLTTRAVSSAGGLRIGDLLPFALVGAVAWFAFKR